MRIDHVIYITGDLDAAAAKVTDELGLEVRGGGRHVGMGTHNKIVPLGGGYLELLAIADPTEAAHAPFGQLVASALAERGDGLLGWACVVDDVHPVSERLKTPLTVVERDGFKAYITGMDASLEHPYLPFFISRDDAVPDPGENADAGGITWLELSGDEDHVGRWIDGADLPLRFVDGPPGVRAIGIGEDKDLRND